MNPPTQIIEADWTWFQGRMTPGLQVAIASDGRVEDVGRLGAAPTRRFPGGCLMPGMVNVHSHAFQRGLRGLGETFPRGTGSFWTWRNAMYDLVGQLSADGLYDISLVAFREMLRAGITCVGEFHYLHHNTGADFAFDRAVLHAARDAGIRMVLLQTFYAAGGFGQPLEPAQQRFATSSLENFWENVDGLMTELDSGTQQIGVAAHSMRAVPLAQLTPLYKETRARSWPFHIHLEEQQREIEDCLQAHGTRPMSLLLDALGGASGVTAIHCTQTPADLLRRFRDAGGGLCVCPLTEANLGDGIPKLEPLAADRDAVSLGTDSNARISMVEEMRWLEYGQRLRTESRGVLKDAQGASANQLLTMATEAGAKMLAVHAGRIERGAWADMAVIDTRAWPLQDVGPDNVLTGMIFGSSGNDVVADVCVGGKWVVERES